MLCKTAGRDAKVAFRCGRTRPLNQAAPATLMLKCCVVEECRIEQVKLSIALLYPGLLSTSTIRSYRRLPADYQQSKLQA